MTNFQLNTAVLFIVFNRPDTTVRVLDAIRQARPPRLYIASDGPRPERPGDAGLVSEVRKLFNEIDWPCDVIKLFRKNNLGCKYAASKAITWFFENEKEGIILEDDCLPHPDFFGYCEELLIRYSNNQRISMISGVNFNNIKIAETYYFSRHAHVWGWATWRRAWQKNDLELSFWNSWKETAHWKHFLGDRVATRYWTKVFDSMRGEGIDTWDYQWQASMWYHDMLAINPSSNLIKNIGFGENATHTKREDEILSNRQTYAIGPIVHPLSITINHKIERYEFDYIYLGINRRWPRIIIYLPLLALKRMRCRISKLFDSFNFG